MTPKEIIRNPLVSSIVLTSLFVVSFAVGPYHSPTGLAVLFAGIATMLLWVNLTGIINLASAFSAETRELNRLIEKINEARDSEALAKISSRATEKMASPTLSLDAKVFYTQVHEHLRVHPHTNLDALGKHFITLGQYNLQLQARHRVVTLTGSLATLAGFTVQMLALFRPEETRSTLQRWGSGTFTVGFAAAAFYHLYVAHRMAHHHSQASLMREALREARETFLFTTKSSAALATSASTPTVGAGTGATARAAATADEVAVDEGDETSEADSPPALRARLPVPATPA